MKAQILVNIVEQKNDRTVKNLSDFVGLRKNKYLYLNDLN